MHEGVVADMAHGLRLPSNAVTATAADLRR